MLSRTLLLIFVFLTSGFIGLAQQTGAFDYQKIYTELKLQAIGGNKMALRDLGSLLDKPTLRDSILEALNSIFFLTEAEKNPEIFTKQGFLNFFYDHYDQIRYSEIIKGYYITPLEKQTVDFKAIKDYNRDSIEQARLYFISFKLDSLFRNGGCTSQEFAGLVDEIVYLDIDQGFEILHTMLLNESWKLVNENDRREIKRKLIQGIIRSCNESGFTAIMEALFRKIVAPEEVVFPLVLITNTQVEKEVPLEETWNFYHRLLDSTGDFTKVRNDGLERIFDFKQAFYDEIVNYYGKVLSRNPGGFIRLNTIKDMMMTKKPISLFYLAAAIFNDNNEDAFFEKTGIHLLEKWSGDRIAFTYKDLTTTRPDTSNEIGIKKKFLLYWASNYTNYEWDEYRKRFVNKQRIIKELEKYDILFRKLTSENNLEAIEAFGELTRGDPQTLIPISSKYRKLLRNINPVVPDIQYNWFENLPVLNAYIKTSGFRMNYPEEIRSLIDSLKEPVLPWQRYECENKLINTIDLSGINALEFDACIYAENINFTCSASRILDYWYSYHYEEICYDEHNLELFLKKAALFSKIGETGICNLYLNKINHQDSVVLNIADLISHKTIDTDILNQAGFLLAQDQNNNTQLLSFFENPFYYDNHHLIGSLPRPDSTTLELLINSILNETSPEARSIFMSYWESTIDVNSIPYLFYLLQSSNDLDFNKELLVLIERVYNYHIPEEFRMEFWINKWQEERESYNLWKEAFYKEDLKFISEHDSLSIADINKVMTSRYFNINDLNTCINSLSKVQPFASIKSISTIINLSSAEHLSIFRELEFKPKELIYLMRLFDNKAVDSLLVFVLEKSASYTLDDKGSLINDLFFIKWFSEEVETERLKSGMTGLLKEFLISYLNESSFISEYEEQNTLMHILQLENFGKTIEDKLLSTFQPELEQATRWKVQQTILSKASFSDVSLLMPYADEMDFDYWDFLRSDFGLPFFDVEEKSIRLFENQIKEIGLEETRKYYVRKLAPSLFNEYDSLNMTKVMDVLSYDLSIPFAGNGGINREIIQYAVIKMLENKYQTTLGFHPRLNENQVFYVYNPRKRANAWRKYLLENNQVIKDKAIIPSFNEM